MYQHITIRKVSRSADLATLVYVGVWRENVLVGVAAIPTDACSFLQLGEKIGVQKSQISRLERGKSITLSSLMRLFSAMEIPLTLDMEGVGKISLC